LKGAERCNGTLQKAGERQAFGKKYFLILSPSV
jgi:hypothetical protein